ncbi:MAG: SDR family NAD(P)-dependent oxidoreductase [Pseudomonadales bacterium]|nr:SDR family NAD(P)-dependent oxidoreductase [Pseudomonadales bacterium]
MTDKVCAIIGVGPGNGLALSKRFAAGGYRVAMLSRDQTRLAAYARDIPGASSYSCDAGDESSLTAALAAVKRDLGAIDVLIYNVGVGVWTGFEESNAADFEASWRINTLGLFHAGQAVAADMTARGGAILISGATASVRGGPKTAVFAPAKAAQRSLAQSMAKTLGPKGVHVAYVIIDGVIDLPRTRAMLPDKPDDFFLNPDDIAEAYYHLTQQGRSAWTFELDLRPFGEKW